MLKVFSVVRRVWEVGRRGLLQMLIRKRDDTDWSSELRFG